jgi:hypothetical protein
MKRTVPGIAWLLLSCLSAQGDTLRLKSGRVIEGTFLGGTTREVHFLDSSAGKPGTYTLADVDSLTFSATLPPAPPPSAAAQATSAVAQPAPAEAQPTGTVIPAGTALSVRLIDPIDVDATAAGQTFRASIDDPVSVDGNIVIPRGADAVVQAAKVQQSGRMKGSDEITLKLNQVVVNGTPFDIATSYAQSKSAGEGKKTGRKVLGGAGLGAIIGGIAGGGTGAAIGAAAGGAGGAALSATGQAHLKLPAETRLQFQLMAAVTIR